ncbi:MAG: fibronectin type III domain-containing protein [Verrucomicrobia bacterium]|nr:fibronectin type III domain-containing protein [Verrucomicrobiota bacterium]
MKQVQVRSIPLMLVLATKIMGALTQFAAAIGLLHVSKVIFEAATNELLAARDAHESGKVELAARRAALKALVVTGQEFVTGAREVLKRTFGKRYTQAWDIAGFRNSLRVPRTPDKLQAMVQSWKTFLTNNAGLEIAPLNLTAAYAETLLQDMAAAQTAINIQNSTVNTLINVRNVKSEKLQGLVTTLMGELAMKLDPFASEWLAFGFNKPGAKQTPIAPGGLVVTLVGANAVSVKWDPSVRAEYYRVFIRVNGVHTELTSVGTPADLDFTIESLPGNTLVEIAVSAVNNGGESAKSAVVTVQTA